MTIFSLPKTAGEWFTFAVRVIIGGLFIWASLDKIINPEAFARVIHNYRILPPYAINIVAIVIPWLELIAGVALLIGFKYKGANILIFAMLTVFAIALISAYSRGLNINCGCFSTSATAKSDLLARIIEDILMLAGSFIIIFDHKFSKRKATNMLEIS